MPYIIWSVDLLAGADVEFAISMGNALELVWLHVISCTAISPSGTAVCVCVCSGLRELAMSAQNPWPVARRDFRILPFLGALLMAFPSAEWVYRGPNDWRSLPKVYVPRFHPRHDPPILITGVSTFRCSDDINRYLIMSSLDDVRPLEVLGLSPSLPEDSEEAGSV